MSVSGIGLNQVWSSLMATGVSKSTGVGQDSDGDNDGSSGGAGTAQRKRQGLMQGVMQTLEQLGYNLTAQGASASNTASSTGAGSDGNGGTAAISQVARNALHAFLYDLALAQRQSNPGAQASGNGAGGASAAQGGYGNIATNMQSLSQGIGSGDATQNSALNTLGTDLQNLIQALSGDNGSGSTGSASNGQDMLQSFLQTLAQNLATQQGTSLDALNTAGGIVSTVA